MSLDGLSWLFRQLPPRIELCQHSCFVPVGSHTWWVSDLQVEASSREYRGEVQFPVEKAMCLADRLSDRQPGEPAARLFDWQRLCKCAIGVLGEVQLFPVQIASEA